MIKTFLVSVTFDDKDNPKLVIVGTKKPNEQIDIVNALADDDAASLYRKLITHKQTEE